MLEEAINYPRNGDDAIETILIGGLLTLFGFLLFPLLFVYGYLMNVLRSGMAFSEEPPTFEGWGELFVEGLKTFAISLAYFLVPLAIVAVTAGGVLLSVLGGDPGPGTAVGALAGLSLASVVSLVFYYVLPAALANFARTGRMGSAFAVSELRPVLFSGAYARGWLLGLAVLFAAGVLAGLLNAVPLVGAVVAGFVIFYAVVVAFYIYGQAFEEASRAPEPPESTAGQAIA